MKIFYLFLVVLFLIPIVSAQEIQELGAFKTESCVTLKQTCINCTFVNFSLSAPPNLVEILSNQTMNKTGENTYIYSFCNTSVNGQYIYDSFGDPDGTLSGASVGFVVNPLGKILTSAQATLYVVATAISLLFLFLFSYLSVTLPSGNKKNELTGYILAVSNLKYVKIMMICFSYLTLLLVVYFVYILSYAYLDLEFLGNIFRFTFISMLVLILPLFIIGSFVIIANLIRDSKVNDALMRGLRIK